MKVNFFSILTIGLILSTGHAKADTLDQCLKSLDNLVSAKYSNSEAIPIEIRASIGYTGSLEVVYGISGHLKSFTLGKKVNGGHSQAIGSIASVYLGNLDCTSKDVELIETEYTVN